MKTTFPVLVILILLCTAAPPLRSQHLEMDPLERALAAPSATGLLVSRVVEDSPAERAGLHAGDILVSYGGHLTPDLPALNAARTEAEGHATIPARVIRDGWERRFQFPPGRLGIQLLPVVKGVARELLPHGTVTGFDLSALAPREDWFCFFRDGEKSGVGRIQIRVVGDALFVISEEILDLATELTDHEVLSVTGLRPTLAPRTTVFRDRLNDWVRTGLPGLDEAGHRVFHSVTTGPGAEPEASSVRLSARALPVYAVEVLVTLMPRERGACYRFLPLYEGSGQAGQLSALVCTAGPDVEQAVARYEWQRIDGHVVASFTVDAGGGIAEADYGPIQATRMGREEALRGQPESVRKRFAR